MKKHKRKIISTLPLFADSIWFYLSEMWN